VHPQVGPSQPGMAETHQEHMLERHPKCKSAAARSRSTVKHSMRKFFGV